MLKSDKNEMQNEDNKVSNSDEMNDKSYEESEELDSLETESDDIESKKSKKEKKKSEKNDKQSSDIDDEMEKKNKEIESLTDMLKRRQADFENYKKRIIKNKEMDKKLAIKEFAFDMININDDLLRAIDAALNIKDEQTKAFVEGVRIVSKRIEETLEKYGIEEIDSYNNEFDPKYNEAVEIEMSEDVDRDTITEVYQKGFKLEDHVIRCAKVRVTKPVANCVTSDEDCGETENSNCEDEGPVKEWRFFHTMAILNFFKDWPFVSNFPVRDIYLYNIFRITGKI